jgi:hypothetical protein
MLKLLDFAVAILALQHWTADGPGRPSMADGREPCGSSTK